MPPGREGRTGRPDSYRRGAAADPGDPAGRRVRQRGEADQLAGRPGRFLALRAAGRRGDAVALFLTEAAAVPSFVVDTMRGSPEWAWMEAFAGSLPQDVALCGVGQGVPAERLGRIAVPTLVLDGGESPAWMRAAAAAVAAAVPGARAETVAGEDHGVLRHPEVLGPVLRDFLA